MAREHLPALNNGVYVSRIDFQAIAASPGALRCYHGCTAAEEAIQDYGSALGTVHDGIAHESRRFDGRMKSQQPAFFSRTRKRICARIVPHICTVAAVLTELNVVAMRAFLRFEHKNEFMLASVERPHPGIVFDPHTAVNEFVV